MYESHLYKKNQFKSINESVHTQQMVRKREEDFVCVHVLGSASNNAKYSEFIVASIIQIILYHILNEHATILLILMHLTHVFVALQLLKSKKHRNSVII